MIRLENYENYPLSEFTYGGQAGSKLGILINDEAWFIKYPKNTKSMENVNISYTTAPLSEYLGSHIYETIGLETQETRLGIANGKIVVACKDFLKSNEILYDYQEIKNRFNSVIEIKRENLSSSSSGNINNLEELELIMQENYYFKKVPSLREHFWNMFIIDTLIDNNDRNNGNWGIILNRDLSDYRIAPVFDNGASFYSKHSDEKLEILLTDKEKFKQTAYDSARTFLRTNDKTINPLKFIESRTCEECNKALLRIFPKISLENIENIFNEIPEYFEGIRVISRVQKEFYLKILKYRYDILSKIYNILIENN